MSYDSQASWHCTFRASEQYSQPETWIENYSDPSSGYILTCVFLLKIKNYTLLCLLYILGYYRNLHQIHSLSKFLGLRRVQAKSLSQLSYFGPKFVTPFKRKVINITTAINTSVTYPKHQAAWKQLTTKHFSKWPMPAA